MQRRAALVLLVLTPALLITSCKSSSKTKATLPAKLSATAIAPATTAPAAPASSSSSTPIPLPPPAPATSAPASPSVSPTPTASAPASPSASGSPVNLDPCQLVTQDEASTLAHATFGPGKEETISASSKECVYGYQTLNVMDVIVAQAADAATARSVYATELGEAQSLIATNLPPGVSVKLDTANTAGVGDKASTVTGSETLLGKQISFAGIYVISGATFFTIGDLLLGGSPPTAAAIQAQAQTVIGRI